MTKINSTARRKPVKPHKPSKDYGMLYLADPVAVKLD
jgi:hypothetical protein